jgi:hypothetical protein
VCVERRKHGSWRDALLAHWVLAYYLTMVMPTLIGGFGEQDLIMLCCSMPIAAVSETRTSTMIVKANFSVKNKITNSDRNNLRSYLAGLIEGDGTIVVPDPLISSKGILLLKLFFILMITHWSWVTTH